MALQPVGLFPNREFLYTSGFDSPRLKMAREQKETVGTSESAELNYPGRSETRLLKAWGKGAGDLIISSMDRTTSTVFFILPVVLKRS